MCDAYEEKRECGVLKDGGCSRDTLNAYEWGPKGLRSKILYIFKNNKKDIIASVTYG